MVTAIEALEQKHFAVAQAAIKLRDAVVTYEHIRSVPNLARMREARRNFDVAASRVV